MSVTKYLMLPREITPFERRYLARLNKIALVFFYLHIPALMAVAWVAHTSPLFALGLSLAVMVGPTIAYRTVENPRALSMVYGVTAMLMGGLLVHFGQGPVQIEMHFYFFALLAMLCMFANPAVNLAAAVTVALHHLIVWLLVPGSVFNYDAQWWVVLVHAAFVVLETVAACYISREFFDNVIGLEKIVQARTASLHEKQRDMRLILDNVEQGLITIDLEGRMAGECSHMIAEWFGAPAAGERLSNWLAGRDPAYAEWLELALDILRDGALPDDVALGQLPKRLQADGRTYLAQYQLIGGSGMARDGTGAAKILVIFTDATERLQQDAAERYQAELLAVFRHVMRDRAGLVEFVTEADELVRLLQPPSCADAGLAKRLIHTLKGNSSLFGMRRFAELCHEIENRIAEDNAMPGEADMAALLNAWARLRADLQAMLGERERGSIDVSDEDYQALLAAAAGGADRRLLARMLEAWRLEPAARRLARIEQQVKGLAERMGKSDVVVETEPNGLRFAPEHFARFWSAFVHVLRNAVDHGVEGAEARARSGKLGPPRIRVSTAMRDDRFIVSVEDDGPGVDWEVLRANARVLGADADLLADPQRLICLPGLSSRTQVTELSGRGVGMSAVRDACEALGGSVSVESVRGRGTRVSFAFPKSLTIYEGPAALLERERRALPAAI